MVNKNDEFVTSDGNMSIYVNKFVSHYVTAQYESGMSAVVFYIEGSDNPNNVKIDTADVDEFCAYLRNSVNTRNSSNDSDYAPMGDMLRR